MTINSKVLTEIFNDDKFENEIYQLFNALIDKELEKDDDEIDFDFIENCCEIINEIISTGEYDMNKIISLTSSREFNEKIVKLGKKGFNTTFKVLLIAAIILTSTISASAGLNMLTGKSTDENTTQPQNSTVQTSDLDETQQESQSSIEIDLTDKSEIVKSPEEVYQGDQVLLEEVLDNVNGSRINYKSSGITQMQVVKNTLKTSSNASFDEEAYVEKNCKNEPTCLNGEYHNFSSWEETKTPTCVDLGEKKRYCTVCGEVQTCPVKATDIHNETGSLIPPCFYPNGQSEDGVYEEKCNDCGGEYYALIPYVKYVVVDNASFEYDGKSHKPKVIAVLDRFKKEIPSNLYNVYIESGENVSPYSSAKTTECGNFYKLKIEFDVDNSNRETTLLENSYGLNSSAYVVYEIKPKKPDFKGIATGNGKIIPYWQGQSDNCDYYQIQYSKSSDFSNSKTVKVSGRNTSSKEITGLNKGDTYYVRIRGINDYAQTADCQYTFWSSVRKIVVE